MFRAPSTIPQDLLLIHDLVSGSLPGSSERKPRSIRNAKGSRASSIDSSGSSSDSDSDSDEVNIVESLLVGGADEENATIKARPPSPSSSESSSSSQSDSGSDSESDEAITARKGVKQTIEADEEDDEDEGARLPAGSVLRTKNEVPEPAIAVPDITEIDGQEPLEKIGEVMSVIENVVVVKGLPSQNEEKASERALDSESLLVFEDRKVLGYVHDTFGPTYQPLYQVKFPSASSIDRDLVTISREVFHVPLRSHFVFPSQLKTIKGSDASNVNDEEVNDDEMEFSDDEAEAAFRRQRKRKREGIRDSSVTSSRFSTPAPSQMHDQDLNESSFYGASPYDEYGPYDMGPGAGRSRPYPLPYDDPYADDSPFVKLDSSSVQAEEDIPGWPNGSPDNMHVNSRGRGQGRGRGRRRGRGRGRGHGHEDGRRDGHSGDRRWSNREGPSGGAYTEHRGRRPSFSRGTGPSSSSDGQRSLSPTSMAIARATGQPPDGPGFAAYQSPPPLSPASSSAQGYWQQQGAALGQANVQSQQMYGVQQMQFGQHQAHAQPHINPRFASALGINMNFMYGQQYSPYAAQNSFTASPYSAHTPNSPWTSNNWPQNGLDGPSLSQTNPEPDEYHP